MSDQLNKFDEVFRQRLSGQTASPPESVWENIQSERSFGHVVANKISMNWRTFGTLLLLILVGGSSFFLSAQKEDSTIEPNRLSDNQIELQNHLLITNTSDSKIPDNNIKNNNLYIKPFHNTKNTDFINSPDPNLLSSLEGGGIVESNSQQESRIKILASNINFWDNNSTTYTRYYYMNLMNSRGVTLNEINPSPIANKKHIDYVREEIAKKRFKDRISFVFGFTSQNVHKSITPKFNLSSAYVKRRQETEQTRLAYSVNANVQYELQKNRFIETGITFTQLYEVVSMGGERVFSNQYDMFEVPLLYGYEQRNAKWGMHVKGGLGLQIQSHYKGYILKVAEQEEYYQTTNTNSQFRMKKSDMIIDIIKNNHHLSPYQNRKEVLDLSNENENPYKTFGVVNAHLAIGLTYYHSIKTNFLITPYYRRNVNTLTKEEALFDEHINYMGINLGARVKF